MRLSSNVLFCVRVQSVVEDVIPAPWNRYKTTTFISRSCIECLGSCLGKFRKHLEAFVDHNVFQRFILFCILINTFSMGIEYHEQVSQSLDHHEERREEKKPR